MPQKAIRFLLPWRGREVGQINTDLSPGIMDALVNYRRVAEWVEPQQKQTRRERRPVHS